MFKRRSTAVAAVLLLAHHRHGNMPPLAAGFVAPTPNAVQPQRRLPPWCEPVSFPPAWDSSRPALARSTPPASNCNYRSCAARGVRPTSATTSHAGASPSGSSTPKTGADGSGAGPATSSSPSAVVTQTVEGSKHPAGGFANGALIPLAEEGGSSSSGAEGATAVDKWGEAAEGNLAREFEWEGGAEAAWTEFEDWLLQDTYSRYEQWYFPGGVCWSSSWRCTLHAPCRQATVLYIMPWYPRYTPPCFGPSFCASVDGVGTCDGGDNVDATVQVHIQCSDNPAALSRQQKAAQATLIRPLLVCSPVHRGCDG